MTARELASVALKVMGIFWIVVAVKTLPNLLMLRRLSMATEAGVPVDPRIRFATQLGLTIFLLAVGVLLLLGTRELVRRFFDEPASPGDRLESPHVQAAAFSLAGVWFLVSAMGGLASSAVVYFAYSKPEIDISSRHSAEAFAQAAVIAAVEAAAGLWLLLGARGLAGSWRHR